MWRKDFTLAIKARILVVSFLVNNTELPITCKDTCVCSLVSSVCLSVRVAFPLPPSFCEVGYCCVVQTTTFEPVI